MGLQVCSITDFTSYSVHGQTDVDFHERLYFLGPLTDFVEFFVLLFSVYSR